MKRPNHNNSQVRVARYEFALRILADFMAQLDAKRVADDYFSIWDVSTIFGPLRVTVSDRLNFVAARFAVVPDPSHPLIKRLPAPDQLNRFSGKWNSCVVKGGRLDLYESILAFCDRVQAILIPAGGGSL